MAALVERGAELTALLDAVASTSGGAGSVVLVEGEAGVGKSALLDAAIGAARDRGLRVLTARGSTLERGFAHGIVRQLFEPVLAGLGDAERTRLLRGPAERAAGVLEAAEPDVDAGPDAAFAVAHALYWLAVNLATDRPLLLVVDDAQWADAASLRWLAYLAHGRLTAVPICLALGWRAGEAVADEVVPVLRSEPDVRHVRPERLSESGSVQLLGRLLGPGPVDAELARICHERTGGNPFLLVELAQALSAEAVADVDTLRRLAGRLGPESIRQSILLRMARLPADAADLARAVAVLDSDAASRHAAELAGLEPARFAEMADVLCAAGVLTAGAPLRFAHPILRTVTYEDMPASARAAAHRRAADLLLAARAPDQAALHLLRTEPTGDDATVRLLRDSARRQLRHGAPDAAIPLLDRALAEPPAPDDLAATRYDLGHAELLAGRANAAGDLRGAYELATEPSLRVRVARELAGALAQAGQAEAALDLLHGLAAELVDRPELALSVAADAAAVAQVTGRMRGRETDRLAAVADGVSARTPAGRRLLIAHAYSGVAGGEMTAAEVAALLDQAAEFGTIFDDDEATDALSPSLPWAIACELAVDRLDVAAGHARRELARSRTQGSPLGVLTSAGYLARIGYLRGELTAAEADAALAVTAAEAIAPTFYLDWPVSQLALVLVERGDPAGARAVLERHGFGGERLPRGLFAPHFLAEARIVTWLALGDLDRAAADAEVLHKFGHGRGSPLLSRRGLVAEALLAAGERERAAEAAESNVNAAEHWGLAPGRGTALRALGLVRRGEPGLYLLAQGVAELEGTQHRLDLARALIDLGAARRLAREPSAARPPLYRAIELADAGGAAALAERARTELELTGARPPRDPSSRAVGTLTAAERRVAELVASGQGNDAVAQSLFVTRRTVETHLTAIYRKLGITGRRELAAALSEGG